MEKILTTEKINESQDLQNKVAEILSNCGFKVNIEKTIKTARANKNIDIYAEEDVNGRKVSIAIECKHWKSRIPQSVVDSFRTVIQDSGCNIGYIIVTSNYQRSAIKSVKYTNVELLTWKEFQKKFFNTWYQNYFSPQITQQLDPLFEYCEPLVPRWYNSLSKANKDKFDALTDKYGTFTVIMMAFSTYVGTIIKEPAIILPLKGNSKDLDKLLNKIPVDIANENGYKEFLEKSLIFGMKGIKEFRSIRY